MITIGKNVSHYLNKEPTMSDCDMPVDSRIKNEYHTRPLFFFSSDTQTLEAFGVHERLEPAVQQEDGRNSEFQATVEAALLQARRSGIDDPIVVGAIPFDTHEPACLYIPRHYSWQAVDVSNPFRQKGESPVLHLRNQTSIPNEADFKASVKKALEHLHDSGEIRKIVLAATRELTFDAAIDVEALLANLRMQNPQGYQFRLTLSSDEELVGISPELLVRRNGRSIVSNPLAGSARRSTDPEKDRQIADDLQASEKDQYEHRLVIDDIDRVLRPYCTELHVPRHPALLSTSALWHLSTRIEGELQAPPATALEVACALHPTPAVCGHPTATARKLISKLESFHRGFFTGAVGWMNADGDGEWAVTIRCGVVNNGKIRLFAGAGMVPASNPDSEWAEIQTKLGTMLRACGISG